MYQLKIGFLLLLSLILICFSPSQFGVKPSTGDPCDGYRDCLESSITFLPSNPDQSLYLGDSFVITPFISPGPNTTADSVSWSYDGGVLASMGGGRFQVIANVSGSYSVAVTASFTVVETVGNSTVTLSSSLSTSQTVETRAFELSFQTEMSNVTNSLHQVLRNPDGSFYHDDEFIINYTYSFLFMQQRPDIKVIVEPQFNPSFVKLTSYQQLQLHGILPLHRGEQDRNVLHYLDCEGVQLAGRAARLEDAESALRGGQLRPVLHLLHVHGLQLGELERLREAIRHARQIRREQPRLFVRRKRQHGARLPQ